MTVPKNFRCDELADPDLNPDDLKGLAAWIAEGDAAGSPVVTGQEWHFTLGGHQPDIMPGERVYIACEGKLRGYAPLLFIDDYGNGRYGLVRGGGAVAVTIDEVVNGFRGFRYRWWKYEDEKPFPDWKKP